MLSLANQRILELSAQVRFAIQPFVYPQLLAGGDRKNRIRALRAEKRARMLREDDEVLSIIMSFLGVK